MRKIQWGIVGRVDVFTIWVTVLLVIGLSVTGKSAERTVVDDLPPSRTRQRLRPELIRAFEATGFAAPTPLVAAGNPTIRAHGRWLLPDRILDLETEGTIR